VSCSNDRASGDRVSAGCEKFMAASERARVQWQLERAFAGFEKKF
jgi:hypothetical protein